HPPRPLPLSLHDALPISFLGVQFAHDGLQANDGLRVQTVVKGGPASKAGLKPGDVVVGIDEAEARDEPTFLPMIAAHKPGDTVRSEEHTSELQSHLNLVC